MIQMIKRESYPEDAKFFMDYGETYEGWVYYSSKGVLHNEPLFEETESDTIVEIEFKDYAFIMQCNESGNDYASVINEMLKNYGH